MSNPSICRKKSFVSLNIYLSSIQSYLQQCSESSTRTEHIKFIARRLNMCDEHFISICGVNKDITSGLLRSNNMSLK